MIIEYVFISIFSLILISGILIMLYVFLLIILTGILYVIEKFDLSKKTKFDKWLLSLNEDRVVFLYFKTEENGIQRWTYLPGLISNYRLFPSSFIENEEEIRKHTKFEDVRPATNKEIKEYELNTMYAKLLLMRDA